MPYVTEDNLTDVAMERWKDIPDPRLRQIMQSLIKHLHGFVRDIELTQAEWAAAIDWLTRTGKLSSEKRQEFILTSDVLGVSMLVDAINHRRPSGATPSTVEGPFHVPNAPPIAYTIPMDGTVGELMNRTNISHMRPAHIHFAVSSPGYHALVTHLFQRGDDYIETDVVYGVKEPLIVDFVKKPPGKAPTGEMVGTPFYEVKYDFVLEKRAQALAAAE